MISRWTDATMSKKMSDLPSWARDLIAGFVLVIAVSLLLNRDLFGISSGETWTVSYGNF